MKYFNIKELLDDASDEDIRVVLSERSYGKTYATMQGSVYQRCHHPVFGRLSPYHFVVQAGGHGEPTVPRVCTAYNKFYGSWYGYSTVKFPRKLREFKKLKCHYLVAENWKPVPITRGIGRGRNNGVSYSCGVARIYHIEPHKVRLAM